MTDTPANPVRNAVAGLGTATWLVWRAAAGLGADLVRADGFAARRFASALVDYLWRPSPVVAALGLLVGLITGVLSATALKVYHADFLVLPVAAKIMAGQIAPLLVGIFAAGRVSVALAARLGAMRLSGEIDALELRGFEPSRFVVAPILATTLVAAPVLAVAAALSEMVGAGFVLQYEGVITWSRYFELVITPDTADQTLRAIFKGGVFFLLSVAAGATAGSVALDGPRALERRTTAAFTGGLLSIFATAALLAALWK